MKNYKSIQHCLLIRKDNKYYHIRGWDTTDRCIVGPNYINYFNNTNYYDYSTWECMVTACVGDK